MLLDPTGPLYVPTRYLLRIAPWMARFVAASRPARVAQIAHSLHALIGDAVQQHKTLAGKVGCAELVVETGQLHLYPDQVSLEKDNAGWALKQQYGLRAERIGREAIQGLAPAISPTYQVGYHLPDQPWVKEPQRYAQQIAEYLKTRGARFVTDHVQSLSRDSAGWSLRGQAGDYHAAQVVFAAGAWSARLLQPLGVHVPLETQRGYHVRPEQRGLGIVFQSYALFPHMSVAQNIGFGLEMSGVAKAERAQRVEEALALVRLGGLGERYPKALSGGQRQRVAIARALAIRPDLLLLDEPMSNLDAKLREEMHIELRAIQRELGITTILVTHDQVEAMTMSDRIAVMHQGRIVQIDTPFEAYERPHSLFASALLGKTNAFAGEI